MIRFSTTKAAGLAIALLFCADSSQANSVNYTFNGAIDFGALNGETYSGQFSFNDAGLTPSGFKSLVLDSLSFSFHGGSFGLANAAATPTADFQNAMFLGISYTVNAFDPAFSLNAGFVDTSDAYFSYTPIHGIAGYGSVTFTPKPVPLPPSLWLVLGGLAGLVGFESRAKPSMFRTPYAKMTVTPTGNANSAAG